MNEFSHEGGAVTDSSSTLRPEADAAWTPWNRGYANQRYSAFRRDALHEGVTADQAGQQQAMRS